MPIITEPKKLSMPQQVQKNKEDIESIFKKIDGLDSTDNVVDVPDMSYILTADELKSVRQPVAFIVYNNNVYLKRKEESNTAYFDRVFSIALSTVITFNSEEIVVDLTNGALGINSTNVNTYSVSQIDNKFSTITYVDNALALKANLSGANFTGAITAPSIIENMSGYTMSIEAVSNITIESVYGGAVKNGNKLTIVMAFYLTRTGDVSDSATALIDVNVPSVIGARLYPAQIGDSSVLSAQPLQAFSQVYSAPKTLSSGVWKFSQSLMKLVVFDLSTLVLNTKYYVRREITFTLSDNLLA